DSTPSLIVEPDEVKNAVFSFPAGSSAGVDGFRPQHFKDLLFGANGDAGNNLLFSITKLCNLMLAAGVPEEILPILYGANLCAPNKKLGGIRPIAIELEEIVASIDQNEAMTKLAKLDMIRSEYRKFAATYSQLVAKFTKEKSPMEAEECRNKMKACNESAFYYANEANFLRHNNCMYEARLVGRVFKLENKKLGDWRESPGEDYT
ncbi:hypothetical protein Bhyg_17313, partial [Pseudolycoriella hygida]